MLFDRSGCRKHGFISSNRRWQANFYRIPAQNLGRPPDAHFRPDRLDCIKNANWRYSLSEAWRPHEDKDFNIGSAVSFNVLGSS
jgi:hypothetical protein